MTRSIGAHIIESPSKTAAEKARVLRAIKNSASLLFRGYLDQSQVAILMGERNPNKDKVRETMFTASKRLGLSIERAEGKTEAYILRRR